ncbi:hypothetical protein K7432_006096 [Basidiobolus ranarum]|uniref:Uncharacterized protein n=1 Tax=Basidiobolus ranarum TaxID=34480 RepID=A0ABR2W252_9FUNG
MTGVKEQTSVICAKKLAENEFIALAFDTAYEGESTGERRGLEDPFQRADNVRNVVTYLSTRKEVDSERIGGLGICASDGYVSFAAQTDLRIKAIATVSAVCAGEMTHNGLIKGSIDSSMLIQQLKAFGEARIAEAKGEEPLITDVLPPGPSHVPESAPRLVKELTDYYKTPRGQHLQSTNTYLTRSIDLMGNYPS